VAANFSQKSRLFFQIFMKLYETTISQEVH